MAAWCPVPSVRQAAAAAAARPPLSSELRSATEAAHESSRSLVRGRAALAFASPRNWAALLSQFWAVHRALEAALAVASEADERVRRLHETFFSRLLRSPAFFADALFYAAGRPPSPPTPEAAAYAAHLTALAQRSPLLLVAHAQTQYTALLAGGQAISRLVAAALAPPAGLGRAAFDFTASLLPGDRPQFRLALARALDTLGSTLSPEERDGLLRERRAAFAANDAIIASVLATAEGSVAAAWLRITLAPVLRAWRVILAAMVALAALLAALCLRVSAKTARTTA